MFKLGRNVAVAAAALLASITTARACGPYPIAKDYYVISCIETMSDLSKGIDELLKQHPRFTLGSVVPTRFRVAKGTPTLEQVATEYGVTLRRNRWNR